MKKKDNKKINKKTLFGIVFLILFAGAVGTFGYRVIFLSNQLPGRLMSISNAAADTRYCGYTMEQAQKVDYSEMKYGYMNDIMLAQMDYMDRCYEEKQMEEIRAINDLTAMSERTEDRLAYEQAKAERDKTIEAAKQAAEIAQKAKEEKIKKLRMIANGELLPDDFVMPDGNDTGLDTADSADTRSNGGKRGKPVYAETHGESLGKYVITAYCTCKVCCGVYSGMNRTASGTVPTTNRTLAVDTDYIPFGTKLVINGQVYVAEDRGGAIKGKRIDMFFYTHKEAIKWGRRKLEVFLAE